MNIVESADTESTLEFSVVHCLRMMKHPANGYRAFLDVIFYAA